MRGVDGGAGTAVERRPLAPGAPDAADQHVLHAQAVAARCIDRARAQVVKGRAPHLHGAALVQDEALRTGVGEDDAVDKHLVGLGN